MKYITDTGFPVGLTKISIEHREVVRIIEACGSNLDAPAFVVSGSLSCTPILKTIVPDSVPRQHYHC